MLAEYFARYKERHPGDLALAMVGPISDKAPEHPDIVATGTVSEADKWDILGGAEVMVNPSAYESFSLVLLEAWSLDVPVLVNASCAATMEHCRRSGGGLWFESYRTLRGHRGAAGRRRPPAARHSGEAGHRYTERTTAGPRSSTGTPGSSAVWSNGVIDGRPGRSAWSSRPVAGVRPPGVRSACR